MINRKDHIVESKVSDFMNTLIKKAFFSDEWNIAIRKKSVFEDKFEYSIPFNVMKKNDRYWFADPLLYYDGINDYIFCEGFDRKKYKGVLGFIKISDKNVGEFVPIIEENFHLSFPCVFEFNSRLYMIPESEESNYLLLYKCISFPDKWERIRTLEKNVSIADPTVYKHKDELYLIGYSHNNIVLNYRINIERGTVELLNSIVYKENVGRAAGSFIKSDNGNLYRLTQDSREIYGKRIIINKVESLGDNYRETVYDIIENKMILLSSRGGGR